MSEDSTYFTGSPRLPNLTTSSWANFSAPGWIGTGTSTTRNDPAGMEDATALGLAAVPAVPPVTGVGPTPDEPTVPPGLLWPVGPVPPPVGGTAVPVAPPPGVVPEPPVSPPPAVCPPAVCPPPSVGAGLLPWEGGGVTPPAESVGTPADPLVAAAPSVPALGGAVEVTVAGPAVVVTATNSVD